MSFEGIKWSFTNFHCGYWIPLTWISHMLDCQLFGLASGYHHLTNIIIHFFNSLIVFSIFKLLLKNQKKSFLIALFFLIHPMNVETVAWIGDRKGSLSMFFGMLSVLHYLKFKPSDKKINYLLSICLYTASLMAKPMLITLPFIFLIFDFYQEKKIILKVKLLKDKMAFLSIGLLFAVITIVSKHDNIYNLQSFSLLNRAYNIFSSYLLYLYKFIFPKPLYIIYPLDFSTKGIPETGALIMVFLAFTFFLVKKGKHNKLLLTGWLFYIIAIMPMIGIVQDATQKMADRFFYFPGIGLFWLFTEFLFSFINNKKLIIRVITSFVILFWSFLTFRQVVVWENSEKLWEHAIYYSGNDNIIANIKYALICMKNNNINLAERYLKKALIINPGNQEALINLGVVYEQQKKYTIARSLYQKVLTLKPENYQALINLGNLSFFEKKYSQALVLYEKAMNYYGADQDLLMNFLLASYFTKGAEKTIQTYLSFVKKNKVFLNLSGDLISFLRGQKAGQAAELLEDQLARL